MGRRFFVIAMTAVALLLAAAIPSSAASHDRQSYIVVLAAGGGDAGAVAAELARTHGGEVGFVYEHALRGFSVATTAQGAAGMARNPKVSYIEPDRPVSIAQSIPTGIQRIFADTNANLDIDGTDDKRVDVDVAVIDTGVDFEHPDLNVVGGVNCMNESGGPPWNRTVTCDSGGDDDQYHGTHVAGTIAALDDSNGVVGVAPGARIWAVKVLSSSGSGSTATVVAGIDWVAANADTIEVANMSLGGSGFSQAQYDAIQGAVNKGVAFAVAAGNSDADANNYSPAAFDNVLTVSALADFDGAAEALGQSTCRTDQDDTLADFSNWGDAVQIVAPGVCILSTYPIEQGSYGTISGTSMASPHAAGALALLASQNNPANGADVQNLYRSVISAGNLNWTDDSGDGIKEPLLDVSTFGATLIAGPGGGQDTNAPPSVTITSPSDGAAFESGATISFSGGASDTEDGVLTAAMVWTSDLDGNLGTGGSFSAVLSGGTHVITASVTDLGGASTSSTVTVTVAPAASSGIQLSVAARKDKGMKYADLTWADSASPKANQVDVYRGATRVTTVSNGGVYTDGPLGKGGGTATYRVCEAGTTTCSNSVTVTW